MTLLALACAAPAAAAPLTSEPNDPVWHAQWSHRLMHVPDVWRVTTGEPNIIVGVVDTGVKPEVADLAGALVPGWDFADNDANLDDVWGHGTIVSTIIAGRINNGAGAAGYCGGCRIMPVRVATGDKVQGKDVARGIIWAVDHGARIINVGFAGEHDVDEMAAITYAAERGVLVFASAGNDHSAVPTYPGAYPGAFAVAATDESDKLAWFSSFGAWVPFAAPGLHAAMNHRGEIGYFEGTSVTAPAVAGVAALLLSANPSLTAPQVIDALQKSVVPILGIAGGRVDALRAFQAAGINVPPPPPPVVTPPPNTQDPNTQNPNTQKPGQSGSKRTLPALRVGAAARTIRGSLGARYTRQIVIVAGRLTATLVTSKARSCSLAVRSRAGRTFTGRRINRTTLSLVRQLAAGTYTVDVRCRTTTAAPFRLTLSAKRVKPLRAG